MLSCDYPVKFIPRFEIQKFRALLTIIRSTTTLTICEFDGLVGEYHEGCHAYHKGKSGTPQHYTMLHAILESGNDVLLNHYLEKYGKQLIALDDNHGHTPLSYLIYTKLNPDRLLAMATVLYQANPLIINMRTSDGFGLPLGTLINKMCYHTDHGSQIDFRCSEVQHEFQGFVKLGAFLISKGAKWQPDLISHGSEKLAINSHLWHQRIAPEAQMILQVCLLPPLSVLVLNYAVDLYVNVCFSPETKTDPMNTKTLHRALRRTKWQDLFGQSKRVAPSLDFLTLLLEEYYQEKLASWSTHIYK